MKDKDGRYKTEMRDWTNINVTMFFFLSPYKVHFHFKTLSLSFSLSDCLSPCLIVSRGKLLSLSFALHLTGEKKIISTTMDSLCHQPKLKSTFDLTFWSLGESESHFGHFSLVCYFCCCCCASCALHLSILR